MDLQPSAPRNPNVEEQWSFEGIQKPTVLFLKRGGSGASASWKVLWTIPLDHRQAKCRQVDDDYFAYGPPPHPKHVFEVEPLVLFSRNLHPRHEGFVTLQELAREMQRICRAQKAES